ncbi:MAG TPA: VWA domain-containing protein [Myxococcota bacterium]|nr:VWA domain-containing protein [Myxococcota bacterium]HRY92656.1 VWA domain-containing protein [Myxococcota bacterium]HSA23781.1 VWA domain-containing protein [Myxococcota bacterium]
MLRASILSLSLALALGGCAGLRLELHNQAAAKPSNVAVYFSAETRDGAPVAGVPAEAFRIYEDGQLISAFESKQTILNPEVAVSHHIALLLDLSGSITGSGSLPGLVAAASAFAERISKAHQVGVFGFDGGAKLIPLVDFTSNPRAVQAGLNALSARKAKDPSTNLHGAVVEALGVAEERMARSTQPLRFATLVVFTDGTDRAHRVNEVEMLKAVDRSAVNVFVIGLGVEVSEKQLNRLGRDGFVRASELGALGKAFDEVAARIEAAGRKFYLLSYCSPARAGLRKLKIELERDGLKGSLEQTFQADGFAPGCDPAQKPAFGVGKIRLR